MIASVLLSVSGLVVAIIAFVVASVISARKKAKNKMASSGKLQSQEPFDNATVMEDDLSSYSGGDNASGPVFQPQTKPAVEKEEQPVAPVAEEVPEPEYSLRDIDDAKRAIIYSEILKPKF